MYVSSYRSIPFPQGMKECERLYQHEFLVNRDLHDLTTHVLQLHILLLWTRSSRESRYCGTSHLHGHRRDDRLQSTCGLQLHILLLLLHSFHESLCCDTSHHHRHVRHGHHHHRGRHGHHHHHHRGHHGHHHHRGRHDHGDHGEHAHLASSELPY